MKRMTFMAQPLALVAALAVIVPSESFAQATGAAPAPAAAAQQPRAGAPAPQTPPVQPPSPPGYVIGPDDVLSIVFWKDKDMTTDVAVRPDGKISLSLLNEIDAAGLTPEQLRQKITEASKEYLEDANVTVIVKAINSRRVFVEGQVAKQGPVPLTGPMTVMQLLSSVGGVAEFANVENIRILRTENGRSIAYKFNLKEVRAGKKLEQNIALKPGDTITVP